MLGRVPLLTFQFTFFFFFVKTECSECNNFVFFCSHELTMAESGHKALEILGMKDDGQTSNASPTRVTVFLDI